GVWKPVRRRSGRTATAWPSAPRPRARPSIATKVPLPSVGERGVEVSSAKRTSRGLAPLELGRPLLEERPRAFLVVLALEGLERQLPEPAPALVGLALEVVLDRVLGAADGQGGVLPDPAEVFDGVGRELSQ